MLFERSKLVAAGAACAALLAPSLAFGQEDPVSATGKGITGGALLGAEAVMLTEAILNVKPAWAYIVGGIAGAGAGAFGGYYAEQMDDAKVSLYLLAGGMALAIPTTVAVLSTTAYEPPADYTEDRGPTDEPVAEPPQPEPDTGAQGPAKPASRRWIAQRSRAASPRSLYLTPPALPPALVGAGSGYLTLSVPAIEVRDVFSRRQLHEFAVKQQTEVRIPVFSAAF
jgi:hypothetical protein